MRHAWLLPRSGSKVQQVLEFTGVLAKFRPTGAALAASPDGLARALAARQPAPSEKWLPRDASCQRYGRGNPVQIG